MPTPSDRDVCLLLERHSSALCRIKAALGASLPSEAEGYDDLWLLRFLLSNKRESEAVARIQETIAYRQEKHEWIQAAKTGTLPPKHALLAKHISTRLSGRSLDGDVINIVDAGLCNPKALLKEASVDEVVDFLMYLREQVFLSCDAETRRTGRLCKSINIFDLGAFSFSKLHPKIVLVVARASSLSRVLYPQFLDSQVLINMPRMMTAFFSVVQSVMSKSSQGKLHMCPGHGPVDCFVKRMAAQPLSVCIGRSSVGDVSPPVDELEADAAPSASGDDSTEGGNQEGQESCAGEKHAPPCFCLERTQWSTDQSPPAAGFPFESPGIGMMGLGTHLAAAV